MKKTLFVVLFALVSTVSFAQVSWLAKGSLNISNCRGSDADSPKSLAGVRFGAGMEYGLSSLFSIQPTIYLSHKGAKIEDGYMKVNAWYLEMPIDAQFRFKVANSTNITLAAGPYIAYGLFGKTKMDEYDASYNGDGAAAPSSQNTFSSDMLKRFDGGLNFEVGAEFGKILVGAGYELGLTKLHSGSKIYNTNFSVNVGYRF